MIKPGGTLYKVDGEPVILMDGTTPAYRDSAASDSDGADIAAAQPQPRRARLQPRRDHGRRHLAGGDDRGSRPAPGSRSARPRPGIAVARADRVPPRRPARLDRRRDARLDGRRRGSASNGASSASAAVRPAAPEFVSLRLGSTGPTRKSGDDVVIDMPDHDDDDDTDHVNVRPRQPRAPRPPARPARKKQPRQHSGGSEHEADRGADSRC